jgi:hypothetical protein
MQLSSWTRSTSHHNNRTSYQVFTRSIPTGSLVYSETEFLKLSCDPQSFLAQNLPTAIEL